MAQNILKEAKKGTRIYNQTHDVFYIHLGGGKWQKDDEFTSQWRRTTKVGKGELNFGYSGRPGAPTIGSDGSFSVAEMGFVITDTSNPNIAKSLSGMEKKRELLRINAPIKKAEKQKLNTYNALLKDKEKFLKKYKEQYPELDIETIFNKAQASGNPKEYLFKNHNIYLGVKSQFSPSQLPESTKYISPYYFTEIVNKIDELEKELNINQPVEHKSIEKENWPSKNILINNNNTFENQITGNGTNGEKVNTNKNKKLSSNYNFSINNEITKVANAGDLNLKELLNNGKENNNNGKVFKNQLTSDNNGVTKKNGSNNTNNTLKDNRFSWEKDLNTKQAKELQNIRNVFGDYRKELNISKRDKGSNMNRRRLTGPMDQHTAEMLGLA